MFVLFRIGESLVLFAALIAGWSAPAWAQQSLEGSATYRERIALPPDALFEVSLQDVSRADAPARVISRVRIESPGQVPLRFTIPFDPARIEAGRRYTVSARISHRGKLMFITDTSHPVLQDGASGPHAPLDLMMRQLPTTAPPARPPVAAADLVNTYWKLVELGGAPAAVSNGQREPYLTLQANERRLIGSGGCNRMGGSYQLQAGNLQFGPIAGTRMACPDGMDQEQAFFDVLGRIRHWTIKGQHLELSDDHGKVLARLQAISMR